MEHTTDHYDLRYDAHKNRIFFAIRGFWTEETAKEYLARWQQVVPATREGFTILGDLTDMSVPDESVIEVLEQIQDLVFGAGMHKAAEVVSEAIVQLAVNRIAQASGLIVLKRQFHDAAEAEAWLDSDEA